MTFSQAVDKIFSYTSFDVAPSLERIREIMAHFGNVQDKLRYIHIAGTNGKGSTSTLIASALTESGYKTGLYTSPHLVSFCERICIDGYMISESDLISLTAEVTSFADTMKTKPTAFDVTTAIAFLHFARRGCDVVVLECGLGGRYDATNIITPVLSVLTTVSIDHKGVLGDTVEQIAREKCGIIKEGIPVVSYPDKKGCCVFNPQKEDVVNILKEVSQLKHSKLILADADEVKEICSDCEKTVISIDGARLVSRLKGEHQAANMLTAYTALRELKSNFGALTQESISEGFMKAYIPARLEMVQDKPLVIIDGGHNLDCASAVRRFVDAELSDRRKVAVIGMMKDKAWDRVLEKVAPPFDKIVITRPEGARAQNVFELSEEARKYNENVSICENPCDAFRLALSQCRDNDALVVFGSFYLAGEIKENFYP
ncbi:MAG: bifunctional folylpolyglutamate synthase/dihydrofolate synthase [Clostridia bacterium]|nr:bifunctional folylpolyglutamate synthase/dihydrofolate synthase [Clostridia bacterium]